MQDFVVNRFGPTLLKASWQAGVIILLVLAVQFALARRWQPRWRHALWWLVVLRLALPVTIPSRVSLFNVFPGANETTRVADAETMTLREHVQSSVGDADVQTGFVAHWWGVVSPWVWVWAAGALFMAACLVANHFRIHRSVARQRPLTDEAVLNLLEDCKQRMGVLTPVTLVETVAVEGPSLFGFLRPRLLLPPGFTRGFSADELRYVFLHELGHVKRHDIFLGWLMAWLQVLHWFNPLVWLAFARMRADRELACDALALSHAEERDHQAYGRTIVKLLEHLGDSIRVPSLAGIIEEKQQMKERIIMIAKFHKSNCGFAVAACLLAVLGVLTLTDAQTAADTSTSPTASENAAGPPRIIATSPKIGARDVDPALKEITVTFDRDMGGGMSWIGGGPNFPQLTQGAKAHWRKKRTCVLPVTLEGGHYYRVGINSTSFQNFRAAAGVAANPLAIYFTTRGASEALQKQSKAPEIVRLDPANSAQNVSPAVTELHVTFDVPMGGGCSWCTAGDDDQDFPKGPEGKRAYWTEDTKTCVLPVELKPGMTYRLSLNAAQFKNFQSEAGVPLEPVAYTFKTSDKP